MRISDWSSDVCSSDLDSELWNAEARYEWYFDRDQRFTLAAFYKSIDNPIEAYTSISDSSVNTSYANAPKATLYGAEVELQKYVPLADLSDAPFWQSRRLVLIGNRSEEHTSELQSLMRISYAVFCLKKKNKL